MANKHMPNENNEMNELFRMINEMESRSLDDDIESAIQQYGGNASYVPPEKGFNPDLEQVNLADLLITLSGFIRRIKQGFPTE